MRFNRQNVKYTDLVLEPSNIQWKTFWLVKMIFLCSKANNNAIYYTWYLVSFFLLYRLTVGIIGPISH